MTNKKRKRNMNKKTKRKLFGILTLTFFFLYFVLVHETTHQKVYDNFGINSTIGLTPTAIVSIPNETEVKQLSPEERSTMNFLQTEVEIFGYQLFPLYFLLSLIVLFMLDRR